MFNCCVNNSTLYYICNMISAIEKNVPIPKPSLGRKSGWGKTPSYNVANEVYSSLSIGDSLFVKQETGAIQERVLIRTYHLNKVNLTDKKYTVRRFSGGDEGNGFRIWRVS